MTEAVNEVVGRDGAEYLFHASVEDFKKIPGSPIAYWIEKPLKDAFSKGHCLGDFSFSDGKNITGDNYRFQRYFWELDSSSINDSERGWVFISKGGRFKKWTEDKYTTVNWSESARNYYKKSAVGRLISENLWFKEGVSWGLITSSKPSFRKLTSSFTYSDVGLFFHENANLEPVIAFLNSKVAFFILKILNPTLNFPMEVILKLPVSPIFEALSINDRVKTIIIISKKCDVNYELSWDFTQNPLIQLHAENPSFTLSQTYQAWWDNNQTTIDEMQRLEEENNRLFIGAYGLQDELTPDVPLEEITLTVNPKYRYGGKASDEDLAKRFQCDTVCELISYAIGCMMGRYSLDQPGLVYANAGNVGFDDLVNENAYASFAADDDGIVPITDQEWFADDVTNRVAQFIQTVWGEAQLHENLAFMAESLSLHAITAKNNESSLDTIRRYLSTKFYKDHLQTYKKRPIYWLFSSGKQKAFECLVYLHRYNEGTLSRMRTEYVIPLMGKYQNHADQLQNQIETADSTTQTNKFKKELVALDKKRAELTSFDESLKNFADMRIALDLDDGVKVNYGKFGNLLVDVKGIVGKG
jgi:hypothetical protein